MLILDSDTPARHPGMPLFNLGFRPFFLGAGIFAVLSIGIWVAAYTAGVNPYPQQLPAMWWHIHEMLFGYAAAVIAGFLLTATKNWTDEQTPHQLPLAGLFLCWAAPRLLLFWDQMLWLAAILDVVFNLWLLWAIALPILKTRCKKQYPILGKIVFLFICNGLFYGEALNFWGGVAYQVLYLTLLVVLGLILMMSRRLIPFFIERGVGQPVTLKNSVAVDIACMVLYLAFVVLSFLSVEARVHAALCVTLALALGLRAIWWHHPGIWHRPLLWSLLVAYGFIVLGFVAYAASLTGLIASSLAIHVLTIGGIGLITLSMMTRVSLGHTGRDVHNPPSMFSWIFAALCLAALVRFLGGTFMPQHYHTWIMLAGVLWVLGASLFTVSLIPILGKPRVDGRYG